MEFGRLRTVVRWDWWYGRVMGRTAHVEIGKVARLVVHLWALGEHPNAVIWLLWGQFPRKRGVPVVDEDDYCLWCNGSFYQDEESGGYGGVKYAGGASI